MSQELPGIFRLDFSGLKWGRLDLPGQTSCDRSVMRLECLSLAIRACGSDAIADELNDIANEVRLIANTGQRRTADPEQRKRFADLVKDLPPVKRRSTGVHGDSSGSSEVAALIESRTEPNSELLQPEPEPNPNRTIEP